MGHSRTARLALALGLLALMISWTLVVPPFRGSDEFDHAYRAAAVARGAWIPDPSDATRGTGAWLDVPRDLVEAARPECQRLPYTDDDDCVGTPAGDPRDDTVRVASGAGRYHPLFYAVIGTAALPFDGVAALYAMRAATALICWLLFLACVAVTRRWAATSWGYVGLALACPPVLVYSGSIVAPNGVEMMAALLLWSSLIACLAGPAPPSRRLLATVAVTGAVLVTLRSLGPLWCLLALISVLVVCPPAPDRLRHLLRRPAAWVAATAVAVATAASVVWIIAMGSLRLDDGGRPTASLSIGARTGKVVGELPLSLLQSIAAFPFRDQSAHPAIYLCWLMLAVGLGVLALRSGNRRIRVGLPAMGLVAIVVPVLIQVATYNEFGSVWQGRYALPYAIGLAVVAAMAIDRTRRAAPTELLLVGSLILFVIAQSVGPVTVLLQELRDSPLAHGSEWVRAPVWLVGPLVVCASAAMWLGACRQRSGSTSG